MTDAVGEAGFAQPEDDPTVISEAGRALLQRHPFIDMHGHAGMVRRYEEIDAGVIATMRPSGVTAAVMCAIADAPVLKRHTTGKRLIYAAREPAPGECHASTLAQLARIQGLLDDGRLFRITEPKHLGEAHAQDSPAGVLAIEGCDFLEGRLGRLEEAYARGVRSIQPVHYRVNELGDIQTEAPVHGGLTAFGREAVREMNRLGVIVDVAHATEAVVQGVVAETRAPILCTHSNLQEEGAPHPRFISRDYARMVADTGGVVGAWIAGFQGRGLRGIIDHAFRLIDAVGIEHVGIGTDMGAGAAITVIPDFSRYPAIPTALLEAGFGEGEVAKVLAGNWLRAFEAVSAARP